MLSILPPSLPVDLDEYSDDIFFDTFVVLHHKFLSVSLPYSMDMTTQLHNMHEQRCHDLPTYLTPFEAAVWGGIPSSIDSQKLSSDPSAGLGGDDLDDFVQAGTVKFQWNLLLEQLLRIVVNRKRLYLTRRSSLFNGLHR